MKRKHNSNIKLTTTSCDYDDETEYRYDEIKKEMRNKKVWGKCKATVLLIKAGCFFCILSSTFS